MHLIKTTPIAVTHNDASSLTFPAISIDKGQKMLLLGASGCGKTTLLTVLAGLRRPSQGQVLVNDTDFYALSPRAQDRLRGQTFGFIFQTLHLLPSLTIAQNILLAADMSGLRPSPDRLPYLLKSLGLEDKAHRKPAALSQGEQQRAALARAILNTPAIIIADEPTSALDDDTAESVMDLLEQQASESDAALLVATHDHRIKHRFDTVLSLPSQLHREAA